MIRTAIIGFGHLGKWHARKSLTLEKELPIKLSVIIEPSEAVREEASKEFPDCQLFSSIEDAIAHFDAAIVVSPTSTHLEVMEPLLRGKKHILCEKPMVASLVEAKKLRNFLEGQALVFQVGHSERYRPVWEAYAKLPFNETGPLSVRINRLAPFKGRANDVDVARDLMIHDLDALNILFKEPPILLFAHGKKYRTNHWDFVSASFHFPKSGSFAQVTAGRGLPNEIREVEIVGNAGSCHLDLLRNEIRYCSKGEATKTLTFGESDLLLDEQKEFFNAIIECRKAKISFEEGYRAVFMVDKVLQAVEGPKLPISIPLQNSVHDREGTLQFLST